MFCCAFEPCKLWGHASNGEIFVETAADTHSGWLWWLYHNDETLLILTSEAMQDSHNSPIMIHDNRLKTFLLYFVKPIKSFHDKPIMCLVLKVLPAVRHPSSCRWYIWSSLTRTWTGTKEYGTFRTTLRTSNEGCQECCVKHGWKSGLCIFVYTSVATGEIYDKSNERSLCKSISAIMVLTFNAFSIKIPCCVHWDWGLLSSSTALKNCDTILAAAFGKVVITRSYITSRLWSKARLQNNSWTWWDMEN